MTDTEQPQVSRGNPMQNARDFYRIKFSTPDRLPTLIRHGTRWWNWTDGRYIASPAESIRGEAWRFLESAQDFDGNAFRPKKNDVNELTDALQSVAQAPDVAIPAWLDGGRGRHPANEYLATASGLLHVPTRTLSEPTPALFNTTATDVAFDPDAPKPELFLRFLDDAFGDDDEAKTTLAETTGYLLCPDNRYQKVFMLLGPKRSGKSTISDLITALVGSTVSPSFPSLGERFGLIPLVGATVALISDLRISSKKTDVSMASSRLREISGGDQVTVEYKGGNEFLTTRLPVRFVVVTNELPAFSDASDALANRFIIMKTTNSCFNCEDPDLGRKLRAELPAILNWALAGRNRLYQRGRFEQPTSSQEAITELEELATPILAFIRECCDVGVGREISATRLYSAYQSWRWRDGPVSPLTKAMFGRNLATAQSGLGKEHRQPDRELFYTGIALKGAKKETETGTKTEPVVSQTVIDLARRMSEKRGRTS